MKVVLLKDIRGLGRRGEVKDVAEGYAQNMLLPRKLATLATPKEVERLKVERQKDEEREKLQSGLLDKSIESLGESTLVLKASANEQGHLFAGIHKSDLLLAVRNQLNIELPEDAIVSNEVLKTVGEHKIVISSNSRKSELKVLVEAE